MHAVAHPSRRTDYNGFQPVCAVLDKGNLVRHLALLPLNSTLGGIGRAGESSVAPITRQAKAAAIAAQRLTT
jgi:hypothetical protein